MLRTALEFLCFVGVVLCLFGSLIFITHIENENVKDKLIVQIRDFCNNERVKLVDTYVRQDGKTHDVVYVVVEYNNERMTIKVNCKDNVVKGERYFLKVEQDITKGFNSPYQIRIKK